ncbi:NosL family protein [Anaeromyxobacter dehalogenans 2CP-1]|uniref:NosL family protein n=1 Tax=Anaeromyxobacter dehalogenans (strain ATCC BAA-258 / DSM 21875 / 2CP-1) TaxID=455488 RepID=B8JB13_ANAD2|nr:nitrous oxide reductase accessory protein NosL [Anaeromyxobacter dehalogenans]ACL63824.1 NosL family protein [Anaeromyxobacter dehalogenans 2CP-1]
MSPLRSLLLLAALTTLAAPVQPGAAGAPGAAAATSPGPKDRCAVCGMLVAKFPQWVASIRYRDGEVAFFDGVKDLLTYWHDLPRHAPGRAQGDVAAISVTDYYSTRPIDGRAAFYVIGGDVRGPMGAELVAFAREGDAKAFLNEHRGERILRFDDATPAVLEALR